MAHERTRADLRADLSRAAPLPDADPSERTEVLVVAPALHESALRFWLSDADEAIAKAEAVSDETVDRLGEAGIAAHGDTGESDPLEAIEDALRDFRADLNAGGRDAELVQELDGVAVEPLEFGLVAWIVPRRVPRWRYATGFCTRAVPGLSAAWTATV